MIRNHLQFAGLDDHLYKGQSKNRTPLHRINTDDIVKPPEPYGKGYKLTFRDGDAGYLHPLEANYKNRITAKMLSEMLRFRNVPLVRAVEVPTELPGTGKLKSRSEVGTLTEWVDGSTAQDFFCRNQIRQINASSQNLVELYLFFLISMDDDFHGGNIIISGLDCPGSEEKKACECEDTFRYFSIDNEKSGAKRTLFLKPKNFGKFPAYLREPIEGQPIPSQTLRKLRAFVDRKNLYKPQLKTFLGEKSEVKAESFFRVAERLLAKGTVPRLNEITDLYAWTEPFNQSHKRFGKRKSDPDTGS